MLPESSEKCISMKTGEQLRISLKMCSKRQEFSNKVIELYTVTSVSPITNYPLKFKKTKITHRYYLEGKSPCTLFN